MTAAAVIGVGLTKFGKLLDSPLHDIAGAAVAEAVQDAGIDIGDIDMAFVANAMASITTGQVSIVGQSVLRPMGFTGIPVFNVDNACAGSSSALSLAVQAVRSGAAQTVLVLGVEKLYAQDRRDTYRALNGAIDTTFLEATGLDPGASSAFVASIYPGRLARYAERWGLEARVLAEIAVKNRENAGKNPIAQYTTPVTVEEVLAARVVAEPLTTLMCAPIGDGASALIVTTAERAKGRRPVWVRASAVGMGGGETDDGALGTSTQRVARRAYAEAGVGPEEIDIAEVHDSVAFNELVAYEELGLCNPGEAAALVADGATRLDGRIPVNTSGGLESRGHPVAATGGAQVVELVQQIRHDAGERQVRDVRFALAETAGGFAVDDTAAIVVTILSAEPAA